MYSDATLKARLEAYGTPDSLAYTLGRTIPAEQDKVPERHFETTNMHFFDKLPAVRTSRGTVLFQSQSAGSMWQPGHGAGSVISCRSADSRCCLMLFRWVPAAAVNTSVHNALTRTIIMLTTLALTRTIIMLTIHQTSSTTSLTWQFARVRSSPLDPVPLPRLHSRPPPPLTQTTSRRRSDPNSTRLRR